MMKKKSFEILVHHKGIFEIKPAFDVYIVYFFMENPPLLAREFRASRGGLVTEFSLG